MKIYGLEQPPRFFSDFRFAPVTPAEDEKMFYVGSGKAAIALILSYLKFKGALPNKMTPILVPEWLGTWVYAQMLPYAFPTLRSDVSSPAVLCYHQYGFPQDMDRVLEMAQARGAIVIEDCAHAVCSFYKGKPLGSMGAFGLFSFSKFAFCYALGGVVAKDAEFRGFVSAKRRETSTSLRVFVNCVKFAAEWVNGRTLPRTAHVFNGLTAMAYARYGDLTVASPSAVNLWVSKRDAEIAARRQNFYLLREKVDKFGICDHLETEGVTPYAVPLHVQEGKAASLVADLRKHGVLSGIYHFDFARCVFEPDFRRCVLVPIHSGMSGRGMEIILDAVQKCF